MSLCIEQQDSIGNRLVEIFGICKKSREDGHMTDAEFVLVAKTIQEAERCKALEHTFKGREMDDEET